MPSESVAIAQIAMFLSTPNSPDGLNCAPSSTLLSVPDNNDVGPFISHFAIIIGEKPPLTATEN